MYLGATVLSNVVKRSNLGLQSRYRSVETTSALRIDTTVVVKMSGKN